MHSTPLQARGSPVFPSRRLVGSLLSVLSLCVKHSLRLGGSEQWLVCLEGLLLGSPRLILGLQVLNPAWKPWIWMPKPLSEAWVILTLLALPPNYMSNPRVNVGEGTAAVWVPRRGICWGHYRGDLPWESMRYFPRFPGSADSQNGDDTDAVNSPNTTNNPFFIY